jgi:hypothetical protein
LLKLCLGTEERDRPAARHRCASAIGEIVPDDCVDGPRVAQRLSALRGDDLDASPASEAGRFNEDVRSKHCSAAKRIDGTDGVKPVAAKLYAVLCLIAGKRVGISDDVGRRVAAQKIVRL